MKARPSFEKRRKEQLRQERKRDKAERREQRKLEKANRSEADSADPGADLDTPAGEAMGPHGEEEGGGAAGS